jgi:hypothetical protein
MHASIDPSYVLVKSYKDDMYAKFVGKKNHAHISNNVLPQQESQFGCQSQ